jgi:hypothetical protein
MMDGQLGAPASTPVPASVVDFKQCCVESCGAQGLAQLETRTLCVEHFVSDSVREIESRANQLQTGTWNSAAVAAFKELLAGCSAQARSLVDAQEASLSPAKDHLLDLLLLTSRSAQHLRRSPRASKSVLIWLRREDPGQTWEEETCTSSISRYGAGLPCRHRVEPGQTVFLCRKDKGGRARARIVYSHFDSAGDRQIGLELLDRDDFWAAAELGAEVAAIPPEPRPAQQNSPATTIHADLEIHFGSQTARYNGVPFELVSRDAETRVSATIPGSLADLKLDPASLSALGAGADAPVRIELTWHTPK